jgi:uncharacterized protein YjbI with pentapeptide repeats
MTYADLTHADVSGADFSGADLNRAHLHRVVAEATKWEGTNRALAYGDDPELAEAEDWVKLKRTQTRSR